MPTMPDVMTYVEHHLRAIVRQRGAVYTIEWFAPDDQLLGTATFQADQVDRWRRDVSIDRAAAIRDFSTVMLQPIGDRPLDRLFDKPSGGALTQHQALIDIDLRARGLADLPWEDLIDAQQRPPGALNLLVRRSSPTFPRIGGAPFRLPMRWTVIGASVQPLQAIVEKTFYGHGQAEIQRGLQIGLAPRLFEVSGEAGAILPSELLYLGEAACAALQDWTPDRLAWALDQWQTRLLILEPDPTDTALLAALAHLADGLIDLGGPAVLITRGGNRPRFLEACLDSLIHDSTLEMAVVQAVHNRSMWGWSDFWPDRPAQTPIVLPPLVFGGGGRGELTRPSNTLGPALAERAALRRMWENMRRYWESPGARGLMPVQINQALNQVLAGLNADWGILDFTGERRGFLPTAEEWRRLDELRRQLYSTVPKGDGDTGGSFANLYFVRGATPQTAVIIPKTEALIAGQLIHLHLNVGALAAENLIINPAPFPKDAIDWTAPAVAAAGGVWLTVVVFTQDFEIAAGNLQYLWLPPYGSSGRVYMPLAPNEAGQCELRVAVYYRDNLLQSFHVSARAAPVGEAAASPGEPLQRARLEYSTVTTLKDVRDVPERAATIIVNRDGNDRLRVQVKSQDLRDDLGQDKMPDFVADIRAALDKICFQRQPNGAPLWYQFTRLDRTAQPDQWNRGTDQQFREALRTLAELGWRLYDTLFSQSTRLALTEKLAGEGDPIHVARVVQHHVIPWAVIYDRPLDYSKPEELQVCFAALDPAVTGAAACAQAANCPLHSAASLPEKVVCPWHFWGFRRIIEQPPQQVKNEADGQAAGAARDTRRTIKPGNWLIGLNRHLQYLTDHLTGLDQRAKLRNAGSASRTTLADILTGLTDQDLALIYFYCHGLDNPARLSVGDNEPLPPDALSRATYTWSHAPLVFINGCHTLAFSAESLSPFISRFVDDHGAAGVIGTEISVWEDLACEVAESFFERLLAGETAGAALLAVRRELLRKRNPLGLVYTLFCDADLKVATE